MNTAKTVGGYEYTFVEPPPDFCICNICYYPSRDPYMTGKCCRAQTICKSCLDQWKEINGTTRCPVCNTEFEDNSTTDEFKMNQNYLVERVVKGLKVYCTNKEKGCKWQGELNDINDHLRNNNGCQYEKVKCSNECGKMIQRQYLTYHVETKCPRREVNCQYCHDTGEHWFIEGQHQEECPKLPLPCPNKCKAGSIPREDMTKHRKKCQLEVINCSNDCGEMLERRCLPNHIKNQCQCRKVNCQYCHDTGEHRFIEGLHMEECPKLPLPCPNKCEVESVPREDMEAHRMECPLEMIQCEYYSIGCEVRMARKDQEKHKKENMEEHLMKTNLALSNQLAIALQRINSLEALLYLTTDKTVTSSTAIVESSLGRSVKLAAKAMMSKSGDQVCPVILKMSNYNEMKKDNVTWCSDSFYTDSKGYKMHIEVYPAGIINGKGTHLACFLLLTKGPHDDSLSWPLRDKFEIKLLNQTSDSQHHSMTVDYEDSSHKCNGRVTTSNKATGWGKHQFISNEHLYKVTSTCQYLKDDCIFIQITKL